MQLDCSKLPWLLDNRLVKILNDALTSTEADDGITICFNDPDFTPESGGFHPVEMSLSREGALMYITDFCYIGQPPMCDLCKALDFDFNLSLFQFYGMENPISAGRELFTLFQSNFLAYHAANAYTMSVEPW